MSYSFDVKEDILKFNTDTSQHLVELQALLRFSGEVIISNPIKLGFTSTNMHVIRYFITLIKKLYSDITYEITSRQQQKLNKQTFYSCYITGTAKTIIEDLGILEPVPYNKEEILDNSNLIIAYLRGAFLAKGSVNDPVTSNYHLEIVTDKELEALFIQRLMNHYEINARIAKRKANLLIYIKEKDTIIDFLRRLGANVTMNEFENIVIKRGLAADVNRLLNIDVANQQKTNNAAKEQLKYIDYLEKNYQLDKLDAKLIIVMEARKENPEASLNELVEIINENSKEKITKSGLNHRFRKIKEIALELEIKKK